MTQFTPFTHNFFESILSSIDSEDPVKANAWLDTLLDVIDLLPVEVLSKEVLAIAVNKAKDKQPVFSRLGSCQLVGKLGLKLETQTILSELIPLTQNLSQDAEWTVRATMCAQLSSLLRGLAKSVEDKGCKDIIRLVLSVLFELGDDEIEMVRLVVVESVSTGVQYLDKELTQTLVVPWIQRFCQQALKNEDKTLPMLAQHWARICRTMQPCLSDEEKEWFSNFYFGLTCLGSTQQAAKDKPNMPDVVADTDNGQKLEIYAEVRHACAVNSAPMVPFVGAEAFVQRIGTLRTLAADHHFVVRRAVAANVLELCRSLHPLSGALHPLFISMLIDPCVDVLRALVPQIGAVIESMSRLPTTPPERNPFTASSSSSSAAAAETCQAVLRCEELIMNGSLWRVQADMLSQLAAFPLCLPCHAIHDLLIPRLWHRIQTLRPLPCRVSAAQTLVLCVRSERRAKQRSALCSDILNKLASGDSCHQRMLFLRACPVLFDLFSRKFIRQHFFLPLVRMAGDKVANVRLRFATLLPRLHVSLRGLDVDKEKQLIVELDSAVRWLVETEKDRDVKDELANFFRWVEDQERTMRSPEANQRLLEDEAADKRKESEEKLIDDQDQGVAVTESPVESHQQQQPKQQQQPEPERTFFSGQVPDAQQPLSQDDERPVALDPDDFYRDAGVRLASSSSSSSPSSMAVHKATPRSQTSRLRPPGHFVPPSRIVPASSTTSATTLPHFGIARGVQQVQPQPSMATAVSIAPPMRRDRRAQSAGSQLAAKSKSQENLASPKPRAARPVSTCLAANELLAASRQSPFSRTRLRASIGGTAPGASRSSAPPPIATIAPIRESPGRWTASRASPSPSSKTVKLSDMKPALPLTRKSAPSADFQFTRRRIEPGKLTPASSAKVTLEETTRLLESLEISPSSTRLRKPSASSRNLAQLPSVTDLASSKPPRVSSPEPTPMQRRNPWRRSLNFATASSSPPPPPPPPPRKNFATMPRSGTPSPSISAPSTSGTNGTNNNNNNNSANNNNINSISSSSNNSASTNSKLPVPAFKRHSYLGSNI